MTKRVSVITGGAGGMGLATAKVVGRDHTLVLCDVRKRPADCRPPQPWKSSGRVPRSRPDSDVTDRRLRSQACSQYGNRPRDGASRHPHRRGKPEHGPADTSWPWTNASAPCYVNEEFHAIAGEGAVIGNVVISMAAHMLPAEMIPTEQFPLALQDADDFWDAMLTS